MGYSKTTNGLPDHSVKSFIPKNNLNFTRRALPHILLFYILNLIIETFILGKTERKFYNAIKLLLGL